LAGDRPLLRHRALCIGPQPAAQILAVPTDTHPLPVLRRFLALILAIAMVWQGVQASWGCFDCIAGGPTVATVIDVAGPGSDVGSVDPADDPGCGTCADHMQHHVTATLHELLPLRFGWPPSERLAVAPESMTSATLLTPLRPPRTIPDVAV
jgi:hypothetical protein